MFIMFLKKKMQNKIQIINKLCGGSTAALTPVLACCANQIHISDLQSVLRQQGGDYIGKFTC